MIILVIVVMIILIKNIIKNYLKKGNVIMALGRKEGREEK